MLRWVIDQGWVAVSHLTWNYRKTRFRLRGARGRAPCQSASDTGKGGKTRCEACYIMTDPVQFRKVCPLILLTDLNMPLCSVDADQVRPFWGRALRYYGKIFGSIYLAAVLAAFVGFRAVGYKVNLLTVAWPGHWSRIDAARADYFYAQGIEAFRRHDVKLSVLALSEAYDLAPRGNEDGALILAQLSELNWPTFSDQIFQALIDGGSTRAVEAWCRALISRGDMPGLARLSEARIRLADPAVAVWTHALVFASRATGNFGGVERLVTGGDPIPDEARYVLALALQGHQGSPSREADLLTAALPQAATSFECFYVLERLIVLGRANATLTLLGTAGTKVAERERIVVLLDACAAAGWPDLRRRQIAHLLEVPLTADAVNLLAAHLIRYPDSDLTALVFEQYDQRPLPMIVTNYGAYNALLCLAGSDGDDAHLRLFATALEKISGSKFATLEIIRDYFNERRSTRPISLFLPALKPLSLEVSYALLTRYPGGPRAAGIAAKAE